MNNKIRLWEGNAPRTVPAVATTAKQILPYANSKQLSQRDCTQIVNAFKSEAYEMASTFIWNKAITALKAQLSTLGTGFIAEMLDRPDIDQSASIAQVLTDYDALRLAHELGVITGTSYFRMKQSFERIVHFAQLAPEELDDVEMSQDEAVGVVRACIESILGQGRIDVAVDFKKFRDNLESKVFGESDREINQLITSPYFFKRASMRMLLALLKSRTGAQLENALGNANVLVPLLWPELLSPEKFQIGRAYSEVVADGKGQAASGLKKILLKVKGFDYVPEDLRSRSFQIAAQKVIEAHEGMNNFYNEPSAMNALARMGSTIPRSTFAVCMTAALCVRLGNPYGISYRAQAPANDLLRRITPERWVFYLDKCLPGDERILGKLQRSQIFSRWIGVVEEFDLQTLTEIKDKDIHQLLQDSSTNTHTRALRAIKRLLKKLGFASE